MSLTQGWLAPTLRGFSSLDIRNLRHLMEDGIGKVKVVGLGGFHMLFGAAFREVSLTGILCSALILVSLDTVDGRC